jgi:hypothetical protein
MTKFLKVLLGLVAAVALASTGVAVAQDTTCAPDDPQCMCAAAGGDWDEASQTCFNVWCGFDDEAAAICDWMSAQNPTGPVQPVEPSPDDPQPAPSTAAPPAPAAADQQPQFTG